MNIQILHCVHCKLQKVYEDLVAESDHIEEENNIEILDDIEDDHNENYVAKPDQNGIAGILVGSFCILFIIHKC